MPRKRKKPAGAIARTAEEVRALRAAVAKLRVENTKLSKALNDVLRTAEARIRDLEAENAHLKSQVQTGIQSVRIAADKIRHG